MNIGDRVKLSLAAKRGFCRNVAAQNHLIAVKDQVGTIINETGPPYHYFSVRWDDGTRPNVHYGINYTNYIDESYLTVVLAAGRTVKEPSIS